MKISIDIPESVAVELLITVHNRLTRPLSTEFRIAYHAVFESIADEFIKLHPIKADKIAEMRAELSELHQANTIITSKGYEVSVATQTQLREMFT